jgi:hypothetical protein
MTSDLPIRENYVEMLGGMRATTAKALEEARRTGNFVALLLYQMQLDRAAPTAVEPHCKL